MDKKKLAVIHIVKKELNLGDKEYRDILRSVTGVESAKDLDDNKFRKLMNVFMRSKLYLVHTNGISLRQKYFIRSLFKELGWDEKHFTNFVEKYYHKKQLEQLSKVEASKLITSLKNVKEYQYLN